MVNSAFRFDFRLTSRSSTRYLDIAEYAAGLGSVSPPHRSRHPDGDVHRPPISRSQFV